MPVVEFAGSAALLPRRTAFRVINRVCPPSSVRRRRAHRFGVLPFYRRHCAHLNLNGGIVADRAETVS
jgi:hypothetical protein